jgi:scyllo-inositol 2-dehydrogenase (NADP+)
VEDCPIVSRSVVGVGLVGYGFGGSVFHAPSISTVQGLELRAIVERKSDNSKLKYPSATIYRSYPELLADGGIDVVVVCTPNPTHFAIASAALKSGKHVVLDKPMTVSSVEAARLQSLADECKLLLSPYHNRRWDGDFQTIVRLSRDGVFGSIDRYESYFDRYRPERRPDAWRERPAPGSGLLFDLGPHLLDQVFYLFGPPQSLIADIRCEREGAVVDDAFDLVLQYPKTQVLLGASMLRSTPRPRFRVQGSDASFTKFGYDPQEDALRIGKRPLGEDWGIESEGSWGELQLHSQHALPSRVRTERGDYRTYYANVRDAVLGLASLQVTAVDGLNVIRALELFVESNRSQAPVRWPY